MTNRINKTNGVAARLQRLSQGIAPFFFLILISVFLSIASENFLTMQNILTILLQISVVGIIAVGHRLLPGLPGLGWTHRVRHSRSVRGLQHEHRLRTRIRVAGRPQDRRHRVV